MNHLVAKKHRAEALRLQRELVALHQLTHKRTLRNGPRFVVAAYRRQGVPVILKICLNPYTVDRHTNGGLQREILTLEYLATQRNQFSDTHFLTLFAFGLEGHAWYLREAATSTPLNLDESNFVFQSRFFRLGSAEWAGGFFASLHQASTDLPPALRQRLTQGHTLKVNTQLIPWHKIIRLLPASDSHSKIVAFLNTRRGVYDSQQSVLTHYEPYASHFFHSSQTGWSMIDWENVDWGNPAHDVSMLWNRGFQHPSWQRTFLRSYFRSNNINTTFRTLFETEIMLQSIHNLLYFTAPAHPIEKRIAPEARRFFQDNIHALLSGGPSALDTM